MNWELFLAALTWCVTFAAFWASVGPLIMLDSYYTPKQRKAVYFASISGVIVCILGIATITGMGWGPQ